MKDTKVFSLYKTVVAILNNSAPKKKAYKLDENTFFIIDLEWDKAQSFVNIPIGEIKSIGIITILRCSTHVFLLQSVDQEEIAKAFKGVTWRI